MLTVPGPQGLRPWTVFSVCNAPGGGGQGGDAQEAAAGVMESWVLGSNCVTTKIWFWAFSEGLFSIYKA